MSADQLEAEYLEGADFLTPGQAARLFGVDAKTVTAWISGGRLRVTVTPWGPTLVRRRAVKALVARAGAA